MSDQAFGSELSRAVARPDVEELRRSVSIYHDWSMRRSNGESPEEIDVWFCSDDPDRSFALIMLAAANYDDEEFLALVAAGLLEDLVRNKAGERPSPDEVIDRIAVEARRTARFRWMLSGVWMVADVKPAHAEKIRSAVGAANMNTDPLPSRPWA